MLNHNIRILELPSFLVLIFTFTFAMLAFQPNMGGTGLESPFNVAVWGSVLLFCFVGVGQLALKGEVKVSKLFFLITILLSGFFIPLLYDNAQFAPLVENKRYALIVALFFLYFFICLDVNRLRNKVLYILLFSCVLQALYALAQMYLGKYLSFYFVSLQHRPAGIFHQYNALATYLSFGVTLSFYLLTRLKHSQVKQSVILLVGTFLLCIPLIPTLSRIGLLTLIFGLCVLLIARWRWVRGNKLKTLSFLLVVVVGLISYKAFQNEHTQKAGISVIANKNAEWEGGRLGSRQAIYPIVLQMIKERPIKGYGYGTFEVNYLHAQAEFLNEHPQAPAEWPLNHPHNEILYWWVEGGIAPVLSIFTITLLLAWAVIRFRRGIYALPLLALISPFVLHAMVEIPLLVSSVHLLAPLVLLGLFIPWNSTSQKVKPALMIIPVIIVGYACFKGGEQLLTTWSNIRNFAEYKYNKDIRLLKIEGTGNTFMRRFEFEVMDLMLMSQVETGQISKDVLVTYIQWAHSTLQYYPQPSIYLNYIEALFLIGEKELAKDKLNYAKFVYPRDESFDELEERLFGINHGIKEK